jgi:hypothetical protein
MINKQFQTDKYRGAVTLITVIIIMAILVVITTTTILLTIDVSSSNLGLRQRNLAQLNYFNCLEESMNIIKDDLSYSGSISLGDVDSGCTADVTSLGGGMLEIAVDANSGEYTYTRSVHVDTTVLPIQITD